MFYDSKFNQDISKWTIKTPARTTHMYLNCSIEEQYKAVIK